MNYRDVVTRKPNYPAAEHVKRDQTRDPKHWYPTWDARAFERVMRTMMGETT